MQKFLNISENDFAAARPRDVLIHHEGAVRFGSLEFPGFRYYCSWCSDLISPTIVTDPRTEAIWIGVDQRVACVLSSGRVVYSSGTLSSILAIYCFDDFVVVISDIYAVLIGSKSYHQIYSFPLRDLPVGAEVRGGDLVIIYADGWDIYDGDAGFLKSGGPSVPSAVSTDESEPN